MAFAFVKLSPFSATDPGLTVLDGMVSIPRVGVWHADLELDAFASVSGAAQLIVGAQSYQGTITQNGTDVAKRLRARVVGGAAGLGTVLPPKSYGSITLRVVLLDVLTACGEQLSAAADPTILGTVLTNWSRMQATGGAGIAALLQAVPGVVWRVLLDGTVWVGFESWPISTVPDTVQIKSEPERRRLTIASDAPTVLPGTTFQYGVGPVLSKQVSRVEHVLRPDRIRTQLFFE